MPQPIEMKYAGTTIYLHEPGCECGLNHEQRFVDRDAKVAILTTFDQATKVRYSQVWFRTGKWQLRDAIELLLERRRNKVLGRAGIHAVSGGD